ncbi:MAG TPA: acyltransferase [Opitutaceae bacterium]|nr:acyltransferase [Opitutaceae bacterium]
MGKLAVDRETSEEMEQAAPDQLAQPSEQMIMKSESVIARVPRATDRPAPRRYAFLDGMRGLSALYVVFHHMYMMAGDRISTAWRPWLSWMGYGSWAVCVFIVLSGFCLMLPVAQADTGHIPGGAWSYFKRRSRRILPPYYAALVLALAVIGAIPAAFEVSPTAPGPAVVLSQLPAFTAPVLVSHLLLIHNLSPLWIYRINGAFWSVATEWQIYFIFPFLLLPAWRRFGVTGGVAIAALIGYGMAFLFRNQLATFQFVALFGMGMAAAEIITHRPARFRPVFFAIVTSVCVGLLIGIARLYPVVFDHFHSGEMLVGIAAASAITYFAVTNDSGRPASFGRIFETRVALWLGSISYSLYLMHGTVLEILRYLILTRLGLSLLPFGVIALPAAIGISYGFFLCFERPFSRSRGRQRLPQMPKAASSLPPVDRMAPANSVSSQPVI